MLDFTLYLPFCTFWSYAPSYFSCDQRGIIFFPHSIDSINCSYIVTAFNHEEQQFFKASNMVPIQFFSLFITTVGLGPNI